ncbi:hypothetical protein QBC36DRAFT_291935 [Triangularia setosa]|uniref:F-box domain-containing protein n=1 Tax=Triangularia setosa TaxID=2587417 RepID=A0AAN7A6C4_9PEZI|nr:hypothetical protein QBC36DRAFT_291935 [Podospora setosa]
MEIDDSGETGDGRRLSIEKKPIIITDTTSIGDEDDEPSAFQRLPDEIIQQILQETDSNGFASLALLNSKWRSVAQQAHLYAHHLSNCPSYAMSHSGPVKVNGEDDLPKLKRQFAKEVKRNLFEAYLRPNETIIKVISNSISSSSCPGGEGIQFSASPKGHHLLAYNSSRIHVVDVRGAEIAVTREFKILRRPAATCINDQGTMLAVLLTEMQVDIYDLTQAPPKRTHSMILDHSPRAIALSPCGSVLAAAYEGGIEVSSLNQTAMATDRRAVKCDGVDALTFSFDGTQILGTTVHSSQPNTVILTAPYYDPGSHMESDDISALWTTSILFPNTSRDCSHAALIQNGKYEEAAWTFTYDRSFETFRAVRIDDLRNGTTYFTGPVPNTESQTRLIPCTLPAASYYGELVSAGFQGKDIWLYGIPEDLDAVLDTTNVVGENSSGTGGLLRRNSGPSMRSASRIQEHETRVPQWQILCDKLRNTFVGGYKIAELEGVSTVKFVADFADSCIKERLVVTARGVTPNISITDDEGIDFVDGGRITLLDFDYGVTNGVIKEYTIEVGTREPEVLEEEHRDMETEVAIVRRRTVAQKRGSRAVSAVMRSATTAASRPPPLPTQPSPSTQPEEHEDDPLIPRRVGAAPARRNGPPSTVDEGGETESILEEQEALDAPYSQGDPRSGTTLRRAATAAANNRRLQPQHTAAGQVEYRRADGRAEHPHESDADNWVPPPPPYQKEDPGDLPAFLRHTVVLPAGSGIQTQDGKLQVGTVDRQAARMSSASMYQPRRSQTVTTTTNNRHSSPNPPVPPVPPLPSLDVIPPVPALPAGIMGSPLPSPPRIMASHERNGSSGSLSVQNPVVRPGSSSSRFLEGDNIYDVSPPDSPALAPVRQHVSREPSDSPAENDSSPPARASMLLVSPPTASQRDFAGSGPDHPTGQAAHGTGLAPGAGETVMASFSSVTTALVPPSHGPVVSEEPPTVRRLSVSRTWPTQPMPINTAAVSDGYPYSAPVPGNGTDSNMSQSFPPLPRPDQGSSFENNNRLSGHFQLPPRVPVAVAGPHSAHPAMMAPTMDEHLPHPHQPWRRTSYQRPVSQQQHYSFPLQQGSGGSPPYHRSCHSRATIHGPQPRRPSDIVTSGPSFQQHQEEMPLIISTPKGVQGAFDAPGSFSSSQQRAETPILSPVPRHPRPVTQSSILTPRTAPERLDTIFSLSDVPQQQQQQQQQQQMQQHRFLNHPPPVPTVLGSSSGGGLSGFARRVPSLNRKPSRAERSAAKNIADAKKRGWSGMTVRSKSRRERGKKKQQETDAMSTAAWTTDVQGNNVTWQRGQGGYQGRWHGKDKEKDKKCLVM